MEPFTHSVVFNNKHLIAIASNTVGEMFGFPVGAFVLLSLLNLFFSWSPVLSRLG
jgi:hypothetical protein